MTKALDLYNLLQSTAMFVCVATSVLAIVVIGVQSLVAALKRKVEDDGR